MILIKRFCLGSLIVMLSFSSSWGEPRRADGVLAVVGDLMVHKPQIEGARHGKEWNFAPSFEAVAPILSRAHLAIGNLETTLSGVAQKFTGYPCFNSPDAFGQALADAGFDVLSTANNHSLDRRFTGLKRTVEQLDQLGLAHTGTWSNRWRRAVATIRFAGPLKVAFVAWTYGTNGIALPKAAPWSVGLLSNRDAMERDIDIALLHKPDLLVALVHCGQEYRFTPPADVKALADWLIVRGVDLVMCSHPHVVQPVELRTVDTGASQRQGLVAWSLGNFISSQRTFPRAIGVILELHCFLDGDIIEVQPRIIPTWVQFDRVRGRRRVRVLPIISTLQMAKQQGRKSVGLSTSEVKQMSDGLNHISKVFQLAALPATQRQEPEGLPHVLALLRRSSSRSLETSKEKEYTMTNEFEEE